MISVAMVFLCLWESENCDACRIRKPRAVRSHHVGVDHLVESISRGNPVTLIAVVLRGIHDAHQSFAAAKPHYVVDFHLVAPFSFRLSVEKSQDDVRSPNVNIKSHDHNSRQKYNRFNVINHGPAPQSDGLGWSSVNNHFTSLTGWRPCKNKHQHRAQIQRLGFICTPPSDSRGRLQSWQWVMLFP
jgi:hypothetical protein